MYIKINPPWPTKIIKKLLMLLISWLTVYIATGTAQLGVRKDWIVQHVRAREGLQYVPATTVTAALSQLEESSRIFSVSEGAYKTVR